MNSHRFAVEAARTDFVDNVSVAPHEDTGWLLLWEAATCAVGAGLSQYVCLGLPVGQDTQTNTRKMSIMQCSPRCITGIANIFFRSQTICLHILVKKPSKPHHCLKMKTPHTPKAY